MKKVLVSLTTAAVISGCSSFSNYQKPHMPSSTMEASNTESTKTQIIARSSNNTQRAVWGMQNEETKRSKNINHYARGIMQSLLSNLQYVGPATPVAVANFVDLSGDFNSSSLIGKQLSEAFMHEVHKLGIPVVDYKLTDYIRVTDNGDLAMSKDFLELSGDIPIRYVLTGTLVEDGDATLVNARIVGIESKAIVASAQGVLPNDVVKHFKRSTLNDGIN